MKLGNSGKYLPGSWLLIWLVTTEGLVNQTRGSHLGQLCIKTNVLLVIVSNSPTQSKTEDQKFLNWCSRRKRYWQKVFSTRLLVKLKTSISNKYEFKIYSLTLIAYYILISIIFCFYFGKCKKLFYCSKYIELSEYLMWNQKWVMLNCQPSSSHK